MSLRFEDMTKRQLHLRLADVYRQLGDLDLRLGHVADREICETRSQFHARAAAAVPREKGDNP